MTNFHSGKWQKLYQEQRKVPISYDAATSFLSVPARGSDTEEAPPYGRRMAPQGATAHHAMSARLRLAVPAVGRHLLRYGHISVGRKKGEGRLQAGAARIACHRCATTSTIETHRKKAIAFAFAGRLRSSPYRLLAWSLPSPDVCTPLMYTPPGCTPYSLLGPPFSCSQISDPIGNLFPTL